MVFLKQSADLVNKKSRLYQFFMSISREYLERFFYTYCAAVNVAAGAEAGGAMSNGSDDDCGTGALENN